MWRAITARHGNRSRANSLVETGRLVVVPPLTFPTEIDCRNDNIPKIIRVNMANKVNPEVVLDSLELGVVDAGFLDELFRSFAEDDSYRIES